MGDLCGHRGPVSGAPVRTSWLGPPAAAGLREVSSSRVCLAHGLRWPDGGGKAGPPSAPQGRPAPHHGVVGSHRLASPRVSTARDREWRPPGSEGLGPPVGPGSLWLHLVIHSATAEPAQMRGDVDPTRQWERCHSLWASLVLHQPRLAVPLTVPLVLSLP